MVNGRDYGASQHVDRAFPGANPLKVVLETVQLSLSHMLFIIGLGLQKVLVSVFGSRFTLAILRWINFEWNWRYKISFFDLDV